MSRFPKKQPVLVLMMTSPVIPAVVFLRRAALVPAEVPDWMIPVAQEPGRHIPLIRCYRNLPNNRSDCHYCRIGSA